MIEDSLGPTMNQTFVSCSLGELASMRIRSIQHSAVSSVTPPSATIDLIDSEDDDEKKPSAVSNPSATIDLIDSEDNDEKKPSVVSNPSATIDLIDSEDNDEKKPSVVSNPVANASGNHDDDDDAPVFADVPQEHIPVAASAAGHVGIFDDTEDAVDADPNLDHTQKVLSTSV